MDAGRKLIKFLMLHILCFSFTVHAYELEEPTRQVGIGNDKAANYARDALMSYDHIMERSNYLIYRFKKLTLGEHADKFMILAPFISGRVEFEAYRDVNFYYNSFSQSGGFRYNINF